MNKTTYTFCHADGYSCVSIDIDHDIATEAKLAELYSFWYDLKEFRNDGGCIAEAVAKRLAILCLALRTKRLAEPQEYFGPNGIDGGMEGWPAMDGSAGIRIIDADSIDFHDLTLVDLKSND